MKKYLVKFLGSVLSLLIIFQLAAPALAVTANDLGTNNIGGVTFNVGKLLMYSEGDANQTLNITVYPNKNVEVVLGYFNSKTYYSHIFSNDEITTISSEPYGTDMFWGNVKTYFLNNLSEKDKVNIRSIALIEAIDSSASTRYPTPSAQLYNQLRQIYGKEYTNRVIASRSTAPFPYVTESLDYVIEGVDTITLSEAMSIGLFIVGGLGMIATPTLSAAIMLIVGGFSLDYQIPVGTSISWYNCSAEFDRRGYCNSKLYVGATHYSVHHGFTSNRYAEWALDTEPFWDVSDNLYDYPDNIMDEAVRLYNREH